MWLIATAVVEMSLLFGVITLIAGAWLAFRNPHRPALLRREITEIVVVTALTASLVFAVAFLINGLVEAGSGVLIAVITTSVASFAFSFGLFWLFGIGARLRRADAGLSPFHS